MIEQPILEAREICCSKSLLHEIPEEVVNVSLEFNRGSLTCLEGDERSGKNLFLRILGLLDVPDSGEVAVDGTGTGALPPELRVTLRNRYFGFVFPCPFLLPAFSVVENIAMPLFKLAPVPVEEAGRRTAEVLELLGITACARRPAADLSTLEEQIVALARALINRPAVVLVEEIDRQLAGDDLRQFMELLRRVTAAWANAAIVTHSTPAPGLFAGRRIVLGDGSVRHDSRRRPGTAERRE